MRKTIAYFHLPGLFEAYAFYRVFLPLFFEHREYFYDWCAIGSLYGAPADCIWGGGRVGSGEWSAQEVLALTRAYGPSARLTFSNSLLRPEHLSDGRCNALCRAFARSDGPQNGVIVHSDLLLDYLKANYPQLSFISSTTKVLTNFRQLRQELERADFSSVVPDFRLNRAFDDLRALPQPLKDKTEFLCNECCSFRMPGAARVLRGRQPEKPRRAGGAYLHGPRRVRGLPLFQRHGEPRLSQRRRDPERLSAHGLFNFKLEGRGLAQRHAAGISALLPDQTGIPAARARGDLPRRHAGLILRPIMDLPEA